MATEGPGAQQHHFSPFNGTWTEKKNNMKETKEKNVAAWEDDNKMRSKESFVKIQFPVVMPVQKKVNNTPKDKGAARDWKV